MCQKIHSFAIIVHPETESSLKEIIFTNRSQNFFLIFRDGSVRRVMLIPVKSNRKKERFSYVHVHLLLLRQKPQQSLQWCAPTNGNRGIHINYLSAVQNGGLRSRRYKTWKGSTSCEGKKIGKEGYGNTPWLPAPAGHGGMQPGL